MFDHGFEDLRGDDHGFAVKQSKAHDLFLNDGHLFRRNFDAQVAARYHESVAGLGNGFEIFDGLVTFDFGDDLHFGVVVLHQKAAQFVDVFRGFNKGERDVVNALFKAKH